MIETPSMAVPIDAGGLWRRILSIRGEMAWIIIGRGAAALGGVVGVNLLTHWLLPTAYGQLALGLTVVTLIQQSVLSPFAGSSLRFFAAARDADELNYFLSALTQILLICSAIIVAVIIVGMGILSFRHQRGWAPILAWGTAFALISSASHALDGMQTAARQRIVVAWHEGLGVWLRFLLGTAVIVILGASAANALIGYAIASLVVFASQCYFFKRRIMGAENTPNPIIIEKWRRVITAYSAPFITWGIFVWAQSSSERWALNIYTDTAKVGQYAVLYQLGYYPVMMASGVLMQFAAPMLFSTAGNGKDSHRMENCRRRALSMAGVCLLTTAVAVVAANIFCEKLFFWMVAASYSPVAPLLPWMVLSAGIFAASQFACLALLSEASTKSLVAPNVGTAILAVGLNLLGARNWGLEGVVLASCIFSLVHFVWILAVVLRKRTSTQ